jgi:hypothetical protein
MKDYTTVYTYILNSTFPFWAFGLIFIIISLVVARAYYKIRGTILNIQTIGALIMFTFALLWTIVVFIADDDSKSFVKDAIANKKIKIVEGVITQFDPMPSGGHKEESFSVNNVRFEYSDFLVIQGFNNTKSYGGPINGDGDSVRISYYTKDNDNYIVKLEIKNYH